MAKNVITAHATKSEAELKALQMMEVYASLQRVYGLARSQRKKDS